MQAFFIKMIDKQVNYYYEKSTFTRMAENVPRQDTHTDKKENLIFLINREIQSGAVAKSYMRKIVFYFLSVQEYTDRRNISYV
jgi:hypothetical protein